MLRLLIALLITAYAIAFAFGALTAVRWPSIVMVMSWILKDDVAGGLEGVDWRQLGIAYGGPYLLAALSFYSSAVMVAGRRRGAILWYLMGLIAGFPTVYLVRFEPGWWEDPSTIEGLVAGAGVAAVLLLFAVCELRYRKPRRVPVAQAASQGAADAPMTLRDTVMPRETIVIQAPETPPAIRRKPALVSAAVARQRASFAYHGQKMHARRQRRA